MSFVEENDSILNCAYDSLGRDELKRFFCAAFLECVDSLLTRCEVQTGRTPAPAYRQSLCRFYTDAIVGMLIEWIKKRGR